MQQQIKLILLFMFLWLVQKANGQTQSSRADKSILVLHKSQLRYVERHGFSTFEYDWKDEEVNLMLNGAFSDRSSSSPFVVLGAVSAGAGLFLHVFSGMADTEERKDKVVRTANSFLFTSAGFFTISIALSSSGAKKVRKAEKIRAQLYNKKTILLPSDLD
ncbi:hypothetical protein [Reichenbachiella sp.]|uniref:hypothetical protein n=1 Tax=Reichenbachiella sp. TaxID=2184521 RepID=UPI003BAE21DD